MSTSIREKLAGKTTKLAVKETTEDHPADPNNFEDGQFYNIEIGLIQNNPYQPRQIFDQQSLEELADSIRQKGVLQPIIIRREQDQEIYLVAGERRLRAAKMAGLEQIPAILTKGNPIEISLIENLQRENLKPIEEAEALKRMIEEYDYTQEQLAQVVGKARNTITQILSLNKLPEAVKKECPGVDIPKRILIEIARKDDAQEMENLFNRWRDGVFNYDQIRQEVRKRIKSPQRTPTAIITEKISDLTNSLGKLDLKTAEENEKVEFLSEIQRLKELLDNLLAS
jgi:ParB family transcriptional regulator, chromosome partitioning protein